MNKVPDKLPQEQITEKKLNRKTFLSFTVFALANVVGWSVFRHIKNGPQTDNAAAPLRSALNKNETIFSAAFDKNKKAKEYPVSAAVKNVRVNGLEGLKGPIDEATWQLQVAKANNGNLTLSLADLKKLPKRDVVFDFKCIEGWSQVSHWGGVPFAAFMKAYGLTNESRKRYVGLQTVDKKYYVGIDMPSALHEQTILAYEMNGAPLSKGHGLPLRLIIPVKYGIKHLKQIGTIYFSDTKPPDYWAERGYDYYAGH